VPEHWEPGPALVDRERAVAARAVAEALRSAPIRAAGIRPAELDGERPWTRLAREEAVDRG
jgi:hypothetical protein